MERRATLRMRDWRDNEWRECGKASRIGRARVGADLFVGRRDAMDSHRPRWDLYGILALVSVISFAITKRLMDMLEAPRGQQVDWNICSKKVAALVPQCELDGVININSRDVQSRLMNQALRKIHSSLSRSQTLVILVNQIRTNLRSSCNTGQVNEVTCGGNALKFYSAVRMRITRRNLVHGEDKITGIGISVQVMKNKLARAMKTADLDIEFGRGLRCESELLEMACMHGIIMREGDGYWINGDFFKNQIEAEKYLFRENAVADELVTVLRNRLFGIAPKDECRN